MELRELRSTYVTLYTVDDLDYKALNDEVFAAEVAKAFGCKRVDGPFQMPLPVPLLNFGQGRILIDGQPRILDRIIIEERKITIVIGGTSQEARIVLEKLLSLIKSFETRNKDRSFAPIVEVDESGCVARLGFNFSKMLVGSIGSNLFNPLSSLSDLAPEGIVVKASPASIRYRISYHGENEVLKRNYINLNEKALSLEVREGSDPEDQLFYASAPVKSNELVMLLESLESQAQ